MAEQGLMLKVGADVVEVTKSLNQVEQEIKQLEKDIKNLTGGALVQANKELDRMNEISRGLKNIGRSGFDQFGAALNRIGTSSTGTAQAFTNLNRVVQDAPFGFIAIQNNIEPLVQSFQQLKAQTGSTGGAIKALAGSLIGAGGVLFAVSAVTSLVTVAIQKYGSLGNAAKVLFGTQTELDRILIKSAKSYEEFNKAFRSSQDIQSNAGKSVSGEIAKVSALVKVIDDETVARGKKLKALSELKGINKEYFGDLTLENIKLESNRKKIDEYTNSLVQAAIVKAFSEDIGKLAVELDRQEKALVSTANAFSKVGSATTKAVNATKQFGAAYQDIALSGESGIQKDFVKQVQIVGDLRKKYKELTDGINSAVSKQLEFVNVKPDVVKVPKVTAKVNTLAFEFATVEFEKGQPALQAALEKLRKETIASTNPAEGIPLNITVPQAAFDALRKFGESEYWKTIKDKSQETINQFDKFLTPVINTAFEALGNGSDIFKSIGQSLKALVVQIGIAIARAAILAAILSATGLGAAVGVGGATVKGFGGIFKGLLGFSGSTGPSLGGLGGGGLALSGGVTIQARGTDLVGVLSGSNARIGRVG